MLKTQKKEQMIVIPLFALLAISAVSITLASNPPITILNTGIIAYQQYMHVNIYPTNVVGTNKLSLGFQLSFGSLGVFQTNPQLRSLAQAAGFRIVRFFDGLTSQYIPSMMPCTYFDEGNMTGTYDWTSVDDVVGKILAIGAQPLIALGVFPTGGGPPKVPPGMSINATTNLPNPESYATYTSEWVRHFKAKGWPVKFYEILNEPETYFGNTPNLTKLGYYMQLFSACAEYMRKENSQVSISFDYIYEKVVLDYWLAHSGPDVDTLDFHKYDEWRLPAQKTEQQIMAEAENLQTYYSVLQAQQIWHQARGTYLPIICSESNMNGASPTTDPRLQQISDAVWLSLLLRTEILGGVSYHVYFELGSSYYSGSYGFGMINCNGLKPWYSYYVQNMIGHNLNVGNSLISTTTDSTDLRSLAWINQGLMNILLINKSTNTVTVLLQGVGGQINLSKIDGTLDWTTPSVQTGSINSTQPLTLVGYTVALLQLVAP
jgi:hypothetical protein